MQLFKTEVFNGYGLKRYDCKRPNISVGFSNRVFLHSAFSYSGMCHFAYSGKRFPMQFCFCLGYIHSKIKNGLYFQGSSTAPYKNFKIVLFNKLFIGGNSPEWLIKLKEIKNERKRAKALLLYENHCEGGNVNG